jgi:hypothetical protein
VNGHRVYSPSCLVVAVIGPVLKVDVGDRLERVKSKSS